MNRRPIKRLALALALVATTLGLSATPALAAQTTSTSTTSTTADKLILTASLCYDAGPNVNIPQGTLYVYGQGNKATSFLIRLNSGTVGGTYSLLYGTGKEPYTNLGSSTLAQDAQGYYFKIDRSTNPVSLYPGRLKTDTFRVKGPNWGETYVDCSKV